METAKRIVILLILVLLAVGPSQSAEKPAERISNTRAASCLVKITCDPAILPLNLDTIDYLLRSSGVGGKAAREVLDFSTNQIHDLFTIEYLQLPASKGGVTWRRSQGGTSRARGYDDEYEDYDSEMMTFEDMEMEPWKTRADPFQSSSSTARPKSLSSSRRSPYGTGRTSRTRPATRRTSPATSMSSADGQTYLFSLSVGLPDEVKPAAKEFMSALVDNLRQTLIAAHNAYGKNLRDLLGFAEDQRDHAQSQLAGAMDQAKKAVSRSTPVIKRNPTEAAVHERLEQFVDLSQLNAAMSFDEAINLLENSVDPPLQIQPNWKDLLEIADLEPTTPAGMDPLTGIKLRKALEALLAGISSEFAEVSYFVDEGVILIATVDALPTRMVPLVYEIPAPVQSTGNARELVQAIQESIEPESWFDLSDIGEGTINVYMGRKLAILQTPEIHRKIEEFLQSMITDIPAGIPADIPREILQSEKYNLLREKQNFEVETVRLRARQSAIEEQIAKIEAQIATKLEPDPVTAELKQLVEMHASQLAAMERASPTSKLTPTHPARVTAFVDIKEKLTRARIELAQRQQQLNKAAGGDQLVKYNNELADMAIQSAEKAAALKVLNDQLDQVQQQLTAATVLDPQVSLIRLATQAFEMADHRVNELNTRIVNMQPPMVSMFGAE
jgi:hypothetical protein